MEFLFLLGIARDIAIIDIDNAPQKSMNEKCTNELSWRFSAVLSVDFPYTPKHCKIKTVKFSLLI